ncbi:outer membrane protein transport protein [Marinifilum sp. D737]|nr:outer membrane protein transport protein [Marinifilum sp. D737]
MARLMKSLKSVGKFCFLSVMGIILISSDLKAQNNTSSPYSYYGYGELMTHDIVNSTGMASLSYSDGSVLNINNPAALSQLDSLKFIFQFGMSAKFSRLKQGNDDDTFNDLNFSKLAFGFKAAPGYGVAVSLVPYTSLGYDITNVEFIEGGTDYVVRSLKGTGGLNQLVLSNGFQLTKNLSLGVNGIYIFGNNSRDESILPQGGTASTYLNTSKLISSGLNFNVGAQYQFNFKDNSIVLGMKYQPKIGIRAKREVEVVNLGTISYKDTRHGRYEVPEILGLSLGVNKGKQLWFGADYLLEKWSETKKFEKENQLVDRNKFSFATIYKANDGYATKFFKKLTYRFGAFYDTGYMEVRDERITTRGFSFGVGMPLARGKGMINMSFEFGQMGLTANNLVREDYGKINIELNLFENWFIKRKYH